VEGSNAASGCLLAALCGGAGRQVLHLRPHRQEPLVQVLQGGERAICWLFSAVFDAVFTEMRALLAKQTEFSAFEFAVQRFDCQGQDAALVGAVTALERANLGLWTFVKILRGRIFPNAAQVLPDDPMSRHLVAFGASGLDGCYGRGMCRAALTTCAWVGCFGCSWRWTGGCRTVAPCRRGERQSGGHRRTLWRGGEQAAEGLRAALPARGRRGESRSLVAHCARVLVGLTVVCCVLLQDIEAVYAQQAAHPQALVAYVPQNDSFTAMKLFQSMGFQPAAQVEVVEDSALLRMRMAWGCSRS
jgi:hypothetical protein